jgi:hypothetical protein
MANTIHVEVSEIINAPAEHVYAVLADYRTSHPAILPKAFKELIVELGGHGAGTVFLTHMEVMGVKRSYHMTVSEPQQGRVLKEADPQVGTVTHFTVEPINNGQQSHLTIATDARLTPGFAGIMERLMNPPIMRRIYKQEMANINDYVQKYWSPAVTS